MSERYWYIKDEKQQGPVAKEILLSLLEEKEIDHDTLVWTQEMDGWQPLASLKDEKKEVPPPPPAIEQGKSRPWVRYWARMIDYTLLSFVVGFFLGLFGYSPVKHQVLFGIFLIFSWVFIEAGFLSLLGFTPGKWLLRTEVKGKGGKPLSYREALSRSLSVWWLGVGAGLPIISLITMVVASVKLTKTGITSWDKSNTCEVTHHHIGFIRTFIVILFFFAVLTLMVMSIPK